MSTDVSKKIGLLNFKPLIKSELKSTSFQSALTKSFNHPKTDPIVQSNIAPKVNKILM